ncbi:helix-hairpin-helix domain-containing protein [Leptolyngbya sp. GB1-A1]|uniref:pentapeptide repeat-containing protein n=1 Tax=Leptolyngbya sp. GB1-A1 TaxID=2933908 RepID=UPI00329A376B
METLQRNPLTLELLQERLKAPTETEGTRLVDLRRLEIDLRSENAAFRDQFYRLIQTQLQRSTLPLGLDLSYSLVRGELKMSDLGIRTPLYGQTLPPFFTEREQAQLNRDRRRLSQVNQLSQSLLLQTQLPPLQITVLRGSLNLVQTQFEGFVNFTNTFFLGRVNAQGARFDQETDWSEARFSQPVTLSNALFLREARFRSILWFDRLRANQVQFGASVTFQNSEFRATGSFHQSVFQQTANFTRTLWQQNADFAQTRWQSAAFFDRSKFAQALFLTESTFEKLLSFRQAQFDRSVNLRGVSVLDQADFGDANFASGVHLNVPDLQFDPRHASILGNPGQIGAVLSVPTLQGNETLLRNLVQNFRQMQQISDANQIEYMAQKLRSRQIWQRIVGTDLNTASTDQLQRAGFSAKQAEAILQVRSQTPFRTINDVLRLEAVDLATYVKVRDRISVGRFASATGWLGDGLKWLGLSLLLLLTRYGTSFWLIFGVGIVGVAYFGLVFWLIDRVRRRYPKPILPDRIEVGWILGGFSVITIGGLVAMFRSAEQPMLTLFCLGLVTLPIPLALVALIYWQGRYHDLMDVSYFVEDATLRQLRFLIGRLPVIPAYPLFRERYMPILWKRRWGWLNYFDFSLNNLLRFGFNDIRLRDEHVPGLITTLAWYQWSLGLLYLALLLWTLSRTIPGLNLLIYFK